MKSAYKPDSVEDNHSSGMSVTTHLKRPTRKLHGPCVCFPIWSCSKWGLPCHRCCHRRGALLPHHFTLTRPLNFASGIATRLNGRAVYFLWHFPWACALQALPGTLPFGVRTFLYPKAAIARPTSPIRYHIFKETRANSFFRSDINYPGGIRIHFLYRQKVVGRFIQFIIPLLIVNRDLSKSGLF
jgi:hypothetical protein